MTTAPTYALAPGSVMLLLDLGLVPERVLQRAGLPVDLFSRGALRLPAEQYHSLWSAAEVEVGTDLSLLLAQSLRVEAFDPLLFALLCCTDLDRALARGAGFKPLVAPLTLDLERSPKGTVLTARWPDGVSPPTSLGFAEVLFWVALARLATRAKVVPLRVTAPVAPPDPARFRAFLGLEIEAGPQWSVAFSEADATRPFLTANEGMWDVFEPALRQRLAQLDTGATLAERLGAALLEALPAGETSRERLSRRLAVGTRTLQRRLNDEGTSFQEVLNATRETLARHYLGRTQLPVGEIAFLLGYQDQNSFYRAFRAWTGTTPESARSAAAGHAR